VIRQSEVTVLVGGDQVSAVKNVWNHCCLRTAVFAATPLRVLGAFTDVGVCCGRA